MKAFPGLSSPGLIDTHAHYDDRAFRKDREEIFSSLEKKGILRVVNIGSTYESNADCLSLSHAYPQVFAAVGVHPSETAAMDEEKFLNIQAMTQDKKVVAVGEIGLDYHYPDPPRDHQKYWFLRQLSLAKEKNLPVVIHSREAASDTMEILKKGGHFHGVIHCYSYALEQAREYTALGFFLGIGGVLTFQNAKKLKEVVAQIPLEYLVLETDCPYLAPAPFRGKRNSSLYLPYVAEAIAAIKGISMEEVVEAAFENAKRLYPKLC